MQHGRQKITWEGVSIHIQIILSLWHVSCRPIKSVSLAFSKIFLISSTFLWRLVISFNPPVFHNIIFLAPVILSFYVYGLTHQSSPCPQFYVFWEIMWPKIAKISLNVLENLESSLFTNYLQKINKPGTYMQISGGFNTI